MASKLHIRKLFYYKSSLVFLRRLVCYAPISYSTNIGVVSVITVKYNQERKCQITCPYANYKRYFSQGPSVHDAWESAQTRNITDTIFEMCSEDDSELPLIVLRNEIEKYGLQWKTDPRLESFRDKLASWRNEKLQAELDPSSCSREDVHRFIEGDYQALQLVTKALGRQFIIPDFQPFALKLKSIFETVQLDHSGRLASYIPQLAKEDPNKFGLSLCTIDGQRLNLGDAEVPFCLQSCVKPFQYAAAVSDNTSRHVHQLVGKEPSGNMFNAIMLNSEEKPHNPMINAGALVVCSMIKPELPVGERFDRVQKIISDMAANEYVSFHNAVFQSEKATSYRNYALAFYLKEKNCFPHDSEVDENVDLYLQLCAVKMTCSSAAVAAATLANGGVCPLKPEKRVLDTVSVRNTLALMHSCGMYDYSGVFAFHVGLPAKSGVAGGIMLVVPNVMGMMIWSPLLDTRGNSVRGLRFCKEFVRQFNFHIYDNLRHSERKSDPRLLKRPLSWDEQRLRKAMLEFPRVES